MVEISKIVSVGSRAGQARVTVFSCETAYLPSSFVDVLQQMTDAMEAIPEEYREEAYFDIATEHGYDNECEVTIEIFYYRPPTTEERAAQKAKEAKEREHEEARERAVLENLKKKYESN